MMTQVIPTFPALRTPIARSEPPPTNRSRHGFRIGSSLARHCLAPVLALAALVAPVAAVEPVVLPLGGNFQAIVDAHPPGTHYRVSAGVHRGATLVPKDGDLISGEPGAVLNGCLTLEEWTFDGEWWVHDAPVVTPLGSTAGVECAEPLCTQSQDFYLDGVRFRPVPSFETLVLERDWFLNRENGKVYLRTDPTGKLAELGGPSRTAIECAPLGQPWPAGVVIEDLIIDKYPCPPQVGAVRLGEGGILRRCVVTRSHSYGVQLMSGASLVQDCYLADNGMCGIGGTGMGATIEGCEIAHNVWSLFAGLAWDNGGVKIAGARDTVFRRNYIHHNNGPGLWWDIRTTLLTIEDNIVEFNHWEGILMEISEQAVIRRNICRWNGVLHRRNLWGAQICVQNASSASIHHNYLETGPDFNSPLGSRQGIIIINQVDRAWDEGVFQGDFSAHSIEVHNNLFLMPHGGHNGVDYGTLGWDTYEDFLAAELVWRNNRYLVGRPLDHRWSWRRPPDWDATVGKWLVWEDWSTSQDDDSTFEPFGPNDYPPSGLAQHTLIKETTGHDYLELKAQLTRRPLPSEADEDSDGLPDEWERRYFSGPAAFDGTGDPDEDGWDNAQEFAAGTHPLKADTDADGLPDAWEAARGLNPLVFDSHLDSDGDSRSHLEEYQDGTDLAVAEPPDLPAPQSALSFWLTPSSRLATDPDGNLVSWRAIGPQQVPVWWFGTARIAATSPSGLPLIDPGDLMLVAGAEQRWGTPATGFTLSFIFQPTEIDLTREWRAVLTNETYLQQGFRLRLESGYLVLNAGQSGGSLFLAGNTRLTAGQPHLITVAVAPDGKGGSLYLDGRLEATTTVGTVVPSTAALMLANTNGVSRQACRFGDLVVFNRLLNHRERRSLEKFLQDKFSPGLTDGPDRDNDGLPDAWEISVGLDPLTPDAVGDEDDDSVSNLIEFQRGLDPWRADTDGDSLPDGWEIRWGTNPLQSDAQDDPDGDGLTNFEEFQNGSDPQASDVDPPFLTFNRMRLWWRADFGLDSTDSTFTRWRDSAPGALDALPLSEATPPVLAPTPWAGRSVVRLSENALVSSDPIDTVNRLHGGGITLIAALRPAAEPAATGFQPILRFGDTMIGVEEGSLVLRDQNGSLNAISTLPLTNDPLVLTLVAPLTLLAPPSTEPARLFVNGKIAAELIGLSIPPVAPLTFGGPNAFPVDLGEVIVHTGMLNPLDRQFAELVLLGKWLGTHRHADDTDGDGLPNWWEHQACSDPDAPDADGDSDWNGESNLAAFQAGRPGFVWIDTDGDGMHDGWEITHGLDPLIPDGDEDPDEDGLPNALEHALLTHPATFDAADTWRIAVGDATNNSPVTLHLRASQRSWARRARWQSSQSLETGSWSWLPPGLVVDVQPGAVAIEDLLIPGAAPDRALIRLGLLPE